MTPLQKSIYNQILQRSRKTIFDLEANGSDQADTLSTISGKGKTTKKKNTANGRRKDRMYLENSTNVLMDLRKAASHPMLFRTRFNDNILTGMTRQLLKEEDFKKRGAVFDLVKEDMEVMTDAELQVFAATYKVMSVRIRKVCMDLLLPQSTRKYLQDDASYLEAGKVTVLLELLKQYSKHNRKVLIFSQVSLTI
jgi:SWI/SNF-related matrix-associated actin-dependent regulator 1 of chromatin subfamily A